MAFSVVCPACKEVNPGHVFNCIKCNTNLIGVPRQVDPLTEAEIASRQKNDEKNRLNEPKVESLGHALWRSLQGSLVIFFLVSLGAGVICYWLNCLTLYVFGTVLIYLGVFLVFVGWFILKGSQGFVRSQTDIFNPMNRVMPGTHSERTRQYWLDYMEGMNAVAVIDFSAALCFGFGWFLISLAN